MSDEGWVPVALACGHVLQGAAWYEIPARHSGEAALVECPEGCGMVEYVVEPEMEIEEEAS